MRTLLTGVRRLLGREPDAERVGGLRVAARDQAQAARTIETLERREQFEALEMTLLTPTEIRIPLDAPQRAPSAPRRRPPSRAHGGRTGSRTGHGPTAGATGETTMEDLLARLAE